MGGAVAPLVLGLDLACAGINAKRAADAVITKHMTMNASWPVLSSLGDVMNVSFLN